MAGQGRNSCTCRKGWVFVSFWIWLTDPADSRTNTWGWNFVEFATQLAWEPMGPGRVPVQTTRRHAREVPARQTPAQRGWGPRGPNLSHAQRPRTHRAPSSPEPRPLQGEGPPVRARAADPGGHPSPDPAATGLHPAYPGRPPPAGPADRRLVLGGGSGLLDSFCASESEPTRGANPLNYGKAAESFTTNQGQVWPDFITSLR
ncbi:uncharacterized protein LOC119521998 [Choloepus didactylus]|uniref:uncharacterized protein LOC119521998 n=1 Tax=Choloepus didactylus TaxID=27675 RepID=UPI0018A045C3|nr:uncharacterized protein LOC119521998 [Choloepus didactylus]